MQGLLVDIGRIGIGVIFLFSVYIDIKAPGEIFTLMSKKNIPLPFLFFVGADCWKIITSLGLIFGIHAYECALLLALYIFIANFIFNDFWRAPKERQNFSMTLFSMYLAVCFGLITIAGCSR